MDAIIDLARKLGEAINNSPQAAALREARDALKAQEGVTRLMNDYQQQAEKVGRLEQENKPIEVEDKHKLQELQSKLVGDPTFKKFSAAQMDYVDLMRKVNEAMRTKLQETEAE